MLGYVLGKAAGTSDVVQHVGQPHLCHVSRLIGKFELPSWVPRAVEWLDFAVSVNGLSLRASDPALSETKQKALTHRLDLFKYACDIVVTSHDVAARSVRLPTLQAPLLCGLASGAASASKLALKHVAAARPMLMSPRIPRYPGELKHDSWHEQSARQALGLQSP